MNKFIVTLLAILFFTQINTFAATNSKNTYSNFAVKQRGGEITRFSVDDKPKITNQGDYVTIRTDALYLELSWNELEGFEFDNFNNSTSKTHDIGLGEIAEVKISNKKICVKSLAPDTTCNIYDISGRLQQSSRLPDNKYFEIDMSHYIPGVYVIKVNSLSFKIKI